MNRPRRNQGAVIPKPRRGSTNNPSGLPADTQIGLISEQPMYPTSDFNYYSEQSSGSNHPSSESQHYQQYLSLPLSQHSTQQPPQQQYPDIRLSQYPTQQQPQQQIHDIPPSQYLTQQQLQQQNYDIFQQQDLLQDVESHYPDWLHRASDEGAHVLSETAADRGTGVIHIAPGASERVLRRRSRRRLPAPYAIRDTDVRPGPALETAPAPPIQITPSPAAPTPINITKEIQDKIIARARRLVTKVLFTEDAMFTSKDQKRTIVSNAISNATLEFVSARVHPFVTKTHRKSVSDALIAARNKLVTIARSSVMLAYNLYLPPNCSESPVDYRVRMVTELISDHLQRLLFMHRYKITEHGQLVPEAVGALKHRFIVHLLTRWIWCNGFDDMLDDDTPEIQLRIAMAMAGAAAYCSLSELGAPAHETIQFASSTHRTTFKRILTYIDGLNDYERTELLMHFKDIISIGESLTSQAVVEISPYDVD